MSTKHSQEQGFSHILILVICAVIVVVLMTLGISAYKAKDYNGNLNTGSDLKQVEKVETTDESDTDMAELDSMMQELDSNGELNIDVSNF